MAGELIAQMAQNALTNVGPFGNFMAGAQDYNALQNQLLGNQLLQQRYAQTEQMNPLLMQEAQQNLALGGQNVTAGQMKLDQAKQGQLIRDMQTIATEALQMPGRSRRQHILTKLSTVDFAGLDESELINEINQLDDTQLEQSLRSMMSAADKGAGDTADIETFKYLNRVIAPAVKNGKFDESIATPEQKAAAAQLNIIEKAGTKTQDIKLAEDPNLAQRVEDVKAGQEGAKEEATLGAQARLLPRIRADIKRAESEATAQGETVTSLTRAKAALPGLLDVSDKLKKLADVATYTTTGKVVDLMAKELGFGSTKGGTARSTMTSVVDNQVLPLLRDTFGAAFTVAEGDRLRDSLLDPDASPEAKKATLDAFIDQKYRNIETQERELGIGTTQNKPSRVRYDAQGNVIP